MRNGPAILGLVCIVDLRRRRRPRPVPRAVRPVGQRTWPTQARSPSLQHLMGTDLLGRDELSRILYGARLSLPVGRRSRSPSASLFGVLIGATAGGVGRQGRHRPDAHVDVLLAIPGILLAIGIVACPGPRRDPDHAGGRDLVRADLRPAAARQPAGPARVGLRHGGPLDRRVAPAACSCATCCPTP